MKISRSELKSIVKECLAEILTEGLGSTVLESRSMPSRQQQPRTQRSVTENKRRFDPLLDTPVSKVQQKISTGNPIFDDILMDTAKTTLPSMLQAEGAKQQPTGKIEKIVDSSTPEELFGDEASSKWAMLAFSQGPRGT